MQTMPVQNQIWFVNKATSNKSFLDMHYFLKERGIKNNDFFLVIHDTGLAGVDPRDPNLPRSLKLRILRECQINYWWTQCPIL